ncbi:hypothetical protein OK015_16505 [Mycobacterium sp. Aquia_216]|uniref:hypothetical protein n=1 Tax=Mycobacterium sp. Aquia_216 TaxID=2991729 RepID=UPI00227BFAA9|nr:hypothetical protein [Mycobacterium sp. Aquia_216]WAJ42862.1 hypothetical protein OK015_16505 [Mycobacterium sp. Aquia_216]
MTSDVPHVADPEIAAAVFADHLGRVLAGPQARDHGWKFTVVDPLHAVVGLTATRPDGATDPYHVALGAEFYDVHPPTVKFVVPEPGCTGWPEAGATSRWLPALAGLDWFHVHATYGYAEPPPEYCASYRRPRQLVCCSMTLEYYISGHAPTDGQRWRQGRHTLGGTLARIQEALLSPQYQGPAGADDS